MIRSAGFAFAVVVTRSGWQGNPHVLRSRLQIDQDARANERGERPDVIPLARAKA
jgi:hypothetical protein